MARSTNKKNAEPLLSLAALPAPAKLFAAAFVAMMAAVCVLLSKTWESRLDYSFGYLAPVFALYVLYDRYPKTSRILSADYVPDALPRLAKTAADLFFGAMLFLGILVYAGFAFIYSKTLNWGVPSFSMTFGFCFAAFAMAYFSSARSIRGGAIPLCERLRYTALFVFPCFIWLVAAPLFGAVEEKISLFLLSKVAAVVVFVMDFLGFIVELKGNTISFPTGTVGVADACSGIRSLTACLFAGSFLAAVMLDKFWKKIALVASSMCFAFLFNLVRALFLSLWAYENGSDSISGFVHDAAGYFVLGMTVLGLLGLVSLFNINPVPAEFRNGAASQSDSGDDVDGGGNGGAEGESPATGGSAGSTDASDSDSGEK